MEKLLIDTDILINYINGDIDTSIFLDRFQENIYISIITYGEVLHGARNKNEFNQISKVLDSLSFIYLSEDMQRLGQKLFERYKLKGGIGFYDTLIASTALLENISLITNNFKHFKIIPNLEIKTLSDIKNL